MDLDPPVGLLGATAEAAVETGVATINVGAAGPKLVSGGRK